jgi:hypothetical protein
LGDIFDYLIPLLLVLVQTKSYLPPMLIFSDDKVHNRRILIALYT